MPTPKDLKQLRSLLEGLSDYRKVLRIMAKLVRPHHVDSETGCEIYFYLRRGRHRPCCNSRAIRPSRPRLL